MASNGIFSGESQAPETPGLQELIDSLTQQASNQYGMGMPNMLGGIFDKLGGKQQSMKDSQLEQLARSMLGYETAEGQQGNQYLGGWTGMGQQQGFNQSQLAMFRQNAGGAMALPGMPGMSQFGGVSQSLLGTQKSALQKAQQSQQSANAAYKVGLERRGSAGTVTSNITD
jgi:hypothetical protein